MKSTQQVLKRAAAILNGKVTRQLMSSHRDSLPEVLIKRAILEARELALETGWPLLVFPILAEEVMGRVAQAASGDSIPLAIAA